MTIDSVWRDAQVRNLAPAEEGLSSKIAREIDVIGGGMAISFGEGLEAIKRDPSQMAYDVAGAVGVALALRGPAPIKGVAAVAGVVGQAMFAKQVVSGLVQSGEIALDTWRSPENTATNKALFARAVGPLMVDGLIMGVTGAAAAKSVEAPAIWKAYSQRKLIPRYTNDLGLPVERIGYREARNYFSAAPALAAVRSTGNGGIEGGTGFFVSDDGIMVTARHVTRPKPEHTGPAWAQAERLSGAAAASKDAEPVKIHVYLKGVEYEARLVTEDPANDLAVLQLNKNDPDEIFPYLSLAKQSPSLMDKIMLMAHLNKGYQAKLSTGRVLEYAEVGKTEHLESNGREDLQTGVQKIKGSNISLPGISGGPGLNKAGEVVGVATHRHINPTGQYALITPLAPIARLVDEARLIRGRVMVRDPHYSPLSLGSPFDMHDGVRPRKLLATGLLNKAVREAVITPEVGEKFRRRYSDTNNLSEIDKITNELLRLGVSAENI